MVSSRCSSCNQTELYCKCHPSVVSSRCSSCNQTELYCKCNKEVKSNAAAAPVESLKCANVDCQKSVNWLKPFSKICTECEEKTKEREIWNFLHDDGAGFAASSIHAGLYPKLPNSPGGDVKLDVNSVLKTVAKFEAMSGNSQNPGIDVHSNSPDDFEMIDDEKPSDDARKNVFSYDGNNSDISPTDKERNDVGEKVAQKDVKSKAELLTEERRNPDNGNDFIATDDNVGKRSKSGEKQDDIGSDDFETKRKKLEGNSSLDDFSTNLSQHSFLRKAFGNSASIPNDEPSRSTDISRENDGQAKSTNSHADELYKTSSYASAAASALRDKPKDSTAKGQKNVNSSTSLSKTIHRLAESYDRFSGEPCRVVHFFVGVSPDFKFDPLKYDVFILFGGAKFGDFQALEYPMNVIGRVDDYFFVAKNVRIPLDMRNIVYKYVVCPKESVSIHWEKLHHVDKCAGRICDRSFPLPPSTNNEDVFRFDTCAEPQTISSHVSLVKKALTYITGGDGPIPVHEKLNQDFYMALKFFWPRWSWNDGFYVKYDLENGEAGREQLSVSKMIELVESIRKTFNHGFVDSWLSANTDEFFNAVRRFTDLFYDVAVAKEADTTPLRRFEFGSMLLYFSFEFYALKQVVIQPPALRRLCKFLKLESDDVISKQQLYIFRNQPKTRDVQKELIWLLNELNVEPISLTIVPLYRDLFGDQWDKQSNKIIDAKWWLPNGITRNNKSKLISSKIERQQLIAVVRELTSNGVFDKHIFRYLLSMFCADIDDVLGLTEVLPVDIIMAWCVFEINDKPNSFVAHNGGRSLTTLFRYVLNALPCLDQNTLNETKKHFLLVLKICANQLRLFDINLIELLLLISKMADFFVDVDSSVETQTIVDDNLRKFLHECQSVFRIVINKDDDFWKIYCQCLRWIPKREIVGKLWSKTMTSSLKHVQIFDSQVEKVVQHFDFNSWKCCDIELTKLLDEICVKYVENLLAKGTMTRGVLGKMANAANVISTVFLRSIRFETVKTDVDLLVLLLELNYIDRFFDKDFLKGVKLSDDCLNLIERAKVVLISFSKKLQNFEQITLCEMNVLAKYQKTFVDLVIRLEDGWSDPTLLGRWIDVGRGLLKEFSEYQNLVRSLRPFVMQVNLGDKVEVMSVTSLMWEATFLSEICEVNGENEKPQLRFIYPEDLRSAVEMLRTMDDNPVFSMSWIKSVVSLNDDSIALNEIVDKIYLPTVEALQSLMALLQDKSVSVNQVETWFHALPDKGLVRLEQSLKDVLNKVLNSNETKWLKKFVKQFNLYIQLKQYSSSNQVVKALIEKLELKNALDEINRISAFSLQLNESIAMKLYEIEEKLVNAAKISGELTKSQVDCLKSVIDNWELVKWVRDKNEKDLPRFVDLAYTNVGESDAEIAMITDFNNVITGFNCLMFNVDPSLDLKTFFDTLKPLWENLKENSNLPAQLKHSCFNRYKLDDLWKASGDLEKSSLAQIENINRTGVYRVGNLKTTKKNVDNCIELDCVAGDDKKKQDSFPSKGKNNIRTYTMSELRDLHSRIILIGSQMDKDKKARRDIEEFVEKFESVLRLASLYVQHYEAGNVLFIDWTCNLFNDPEHGRQAMCRLPNYSNEAIFGQKDGQATVLDQVNAMCTFFTNALAEWIEYLEMMRKNFFELNYFTNKQIEFLRTKLALIIKKHLDPKASMMLLVLDPDLRPDFVRELVISCKVDEEEAAAKEEAMEEELYDAELAFVDYVMAYGVSERKLAIAAARAVNFEDEDAALKWANENPLPVSKSEVKLVRDPSYAGQISELVEQLATKEEHLLASKLDVLWRDHISTKEKNSYEEFLGVHQLGQILRQIAEQSTRSHEATNFRWIRENEPNLFLAVNDDIYRFVLSLYVHFGGPNCCPTFETVLMCSADTTIENVKLFIRRIEFSEGQHLFSIVEVDKLKSDVCIELESFLEDLRKWRRKFFLALIADEKLFSKSPASNYLSRFSTKFSNPIKWFDSKSFLTNFLRKRTEKCLNVVDIPPEFAFQYFRSAFFTSVGYGHGKSEIVALQGKVVKGQLIKIPVHQQELTADNLYSNLEMFVVDPSPAVKDKRGRIFHIDVLNHRTSGVDKMLFQLLVLGGFSTSDGNVWRWLPGDFYAFEMTSTPNRLLSMKMNDEELKDALNFRFLLPTVLCHNPEMTLRLIEGKIANNQHVMNRRLDENWTNDVETQRCFQYLSTPNELLDALVFERNENAQCVDGVQILQILLKNCGIDDPSWSELKSFANFLNSQLEKCEMSPFCHVQELPGFKSFVVKFMIQMSRDFATRSLEISEDAGSLIRDRTTQVDAYQFEKKQRWEQKAHPYLFFNEDGGTVSFFGCNLTLNGDLIDQNTGVVLPHGGRMASTTLIAGLIVNGVEDLQKKFDDLKENKFVKLCMVFGVPFGEVIDEAYAMNHPNESYVFVGAGRQRRRFLVKNPDKSYEITSDCALKILAIKMRFRCGIPVVIMGETGCGKTKLIQYMCKLERNGVDDGVAVENLVIVRIHGGTTKQNIENEVNRALELAKKNFQMFGLSTVLFFDEANTTPAISLIKEIMCDGTMNGRVLNLAENHLNVIAAVNPYRKHSDEMVTKLETSGLGYHVSDSKVFEKFGDVPLRRLVYRVHPLPASMLPLVWDFGTLTSETERLYTRQMVANTLNTDCGFPLDPATIEVFSDILTAAQTWMRKQKDEASFVSLRNVERALMVTEWFYERRGTFFQTSADTNAAAFSVLMAICVCYRCSLQSKRMEFDLFMLQKFRKPLQLTTSTSNGENCIVNLVKECQSKFLDKVDVPANIAINQALRENLFMMTLCIELRIPLFLVGKPGSSKSLAKTILADNMRGKPSPSPLYQTLKQAQLVSFQCSPLATADGVETIFRQCARHQKGQNLNQYVAAAVFDEIGLAEDSPELPLKALHGLLETGCTISGEELNETHQVAFVGISNWALDPAKMNRGIFVTRIDPTKIQLLETAKRICMHDKEGSVYCFVKSLIEPITSAYMQVCKKQEEQFYGLRDFYSLLKMLYEIAEEKKRQPRLRDVINAVRHNFSGQKNRSAFLVFHAELAALFPQEEETTSCVSTLIEENLKRSANKSHISRYLLILSENYAAMRLIKNVKALENAEIIFGSSFPQDLEYTQVCRNINKIKVCMDKGRTVILLNLEQLYESLYDLLNQAFMDMGGKYYVDLGLGTHRLKCHVHKDFRLVVVAECDDATKHFPLALLNRLEKHFVSTMEDAKVEHREAVELLQEWADKFATIKIRNSSRKWQPQDVFVGYHCDSATSIVSEICRRPENISKSSDEIFTSGKAFLLQSATPDAVVRLTSSELLEESDEIRRIYFREQFHGSFFQHLQNTQFFVDGSCRLTQITTHSQLFSQNDNFKLAESLKLKSEQVAVVTLQNYNTEQEFIKRVRKIFKVSVDSRHVLIVQCLAGDECQNLIAGCRFILENLMKSEEFREISIEIFLLINLPRVSGGCFKGFPTVQWNCLHIDELHAETNEIEDYTDLIGRSVPQLLADFIDQNSKSINFDFIVKKSLQVASSYIRDESERKLSRLVLLQNYWRENDKFRRVFYFWLHRLLEQKCSKDDKWAFNEAANAAAILEHKTYKQSLCKYVESLVVPILSGLISSIDNGGNLDLLRFDDSLQNWQRSEMWLHLFADTEFLGLKHESNVFQTKDVGGFAVARQEFVVSSEIRFTLKVPFFWLIKEKVNSLLENFDFGTSDLNAMVTKCLVLLKEKSWGSYVCRLSNDEFYAAYVHDFILSTFVVEDGSNLANLLMEWLFISGRNSETQSPIIACPLIYQNLSRRMNFFVEMQRTHPAIADQLATKTDLNKYNFALDLLSVERVVAVLEGLMSDIDPKVGVKILFNRQKENRAQFVQLVKYSSILVKRIFKLYEDLDNSVAVNELLLRLKKCWFAAEVCSSFLHHVSSIDYPLNVANLWKDNLKLDDGINSVKFWEKMNILMDLWIQQLLEKYFRIKSAKLNCALCNKVMASVKPTILPCLHVMHEKCFYDFSKSFSAAGGVCPADKCKTEILQNVHDAASSALKEKTQEYLADRQSLMNFFLDSVCVLFNRDSPPSLDVLHILLSYVTHESADHSNPTTKQLSPFPDQDAIDKSPVVRSFLLQLILNNNLNALEHVDAYLQDGQKFLSKNDEDLVQFIWMCIRCAEDAFSTKLVRECGFGRSTNVSRIKFISANVPAQVELMFKDEFSADDVKTVARTRFVLSTFADVIHDFAGTYRNSAISRADKVSEVKRLNERIRIILSKSSTPDAKTLLLRLLCFRFGFDFVRSLQSNDLLSWIVDDQSLDPNDVPDVFVIYGKQYIDVKNAVFDCFRSKDVKALAQLRIVNGEQFDMLVCFSMQQWLKSRDVAVLTSEQTNTLDLIVSQISSGRIRGVVEQLLFAGYWKKLVETSKFLSFATFAFHLNAALKILPASGCIEFFTTLLNVGNVNQLFFPCMPDYELDPNLAALLMTPMPNGQKPTLNECPNGHPYVILDCGKPNALGVCTDCKKAIGGTSHAFAPGNKPMANFDDKTKRGYCLPDVSHSGDEVTPVRNLDRLSVAVTRFLMSSTMWLGSLENPDEISNCTNPQIVSANIVEFLHEHVNRDLHFLSRLLSVSIEDVLLLMHSLLSGWVKEKRGSRNNQNLTAKTGRFAWENYFRQEVLDPVLPFAANVISDCTTKMTSVCNQNKLYTQVYGDAKSEELKSLIWSYRSPNSLESLCNKLLSQIEKSKDKRLDIMEEFFKKINELKSLQYLPAVVELHKEMKSRFGGVVNISEVRTTSIKHFLNELPKAEAERMKFLVQSYFAALQLVVPKLNNFQFILNTRQKHTKEKTDDTRLVSIENWMIPNMEDIFANSLTSILPLAYGEGYCGAALIDILIRHQNEFVNFCAKHLDSTENINVVSLNETTPDQLIHFDVDRDIYPALMLHRNFSYGVETKTDEYFDLPRLQRRLECFYMKDLNCLQYIVPLVKTKESMLLDCLGRIRCSEKSRRMPEGSLLTAQQQREILSLLTSKAHETRLLLDLIELLIRFSVSVDSYDESVLEFAKKICLSEITSHVVSKILNSFSLCHLPALWQLVTFHSKYLLMSNQEDPFSDLSEQCKVELSDDESKCLVDNLSNVDLLKFLLEMTEFLQFHLALGATGLERLRDIGQNVSSSRDIYEEEISTYLINRDECSLDVDFELDGCLKLKHAVLIWKTAAKRFASSRKL